MARVRLSVQQVQRRTPGVWELYSLLMVFGAAVYIPLSYALPWMPPLHSPFRYAGFACPLCGGTRAVTALALGRLGTAVTYNPLALAILLLLLWGVISYLVIVLPAGRRVVLVTSPLERRVLWVVIPLLFVANWVWVLWSGMYLVPFKP